MLRNGQAVLLEGHSQGAVITVAALAQLVRTAPDQLDRLSVITYGNPLRRLYRRWFPEYTRRLLNDLGIEGAPKQIPPMVNFYRSTDPIGSELFDGSKEKGDRWLADPPINAHRPGDGDPLIRGHSHAGYVEEHDFREYSHDQIRGLGELLAGAVNVIAVATVRVQPTGQPVVGIAGESP